MKLRLLEKPLESVNGSAISDVPVSTREFQVNDAPLIRIRPSRSWVALDLRDLWAYRELLFFLTWRDVKVRYKQTVLGVAWAVIQPLFTMLIFTLFFGRLAGVPSDGIPYPLFAFAALVPWTFFSNAVTNSGNSLVGNANLISKVYFPRLIVPGSAVGAGLVDFAISFVLLGFMMIFYRQPLSWNLLLLPVLVILLSLLALGVGLWMSALNVKYRDIRYALPFVVQLWMFVTPIIYPASMVPERWRWALALNPLAGIIEGFRASLFGRPIDWQLLGISTAVTLALLTYAAYLFRRLEKSFADVV
jgi:lipopolysaccharide transport system permease protein